MATILIVDDEPHTVTLIRFCLRPLSATLLSASDGSAAPQLSVSEQDGAVLAEGERPEGRNERNAEAARPGFSLN